MGLGPPKRDAAGAGRAQGTGEGGEVGKGGELILITNYGRELYVGILSLSLPLNQVGARGPREGK